MIVSSFDLEAIDHVRALAPELETAYLVSFIANHAKLVDQLVARGHRGVHPWHLLVNRRLVARCHAAGLAVRPWTVDDPDRIAKLATIGVDAICTNVPASRSPCSGQSQREGVRTMAELEAAGLAEVVAVDLVGEASLALDDDVGQVGGLVEVGLVGEPAAPQGSADGADDRPGVHACER